MGLLSWMHKDFLLFFMYDIYDLSSFGIVFAIWSSLSAPPLPLGNTPRFRGRVSFKQTAWEHNPLTTNH